MAETNDIITATIVEFCRISGIGRTRVYEMLASGDLQSVKIDKKRLIVVDSYRRMIEESLVPHLSRGRARTCANDIGRLTEKD